MLSLPEHSIKVVEEYYELLKNKIERARDNSKLSASAKYFLSNKKIKEIICDKPEKLIRHHRQIIPELGVGFNLTEYNRYCLLKRKKNNLTDPTEINIYNKYNPQATELESVFNYKKFISKSQSTSYHLAKIHNRNTCTYCNRLYTNTVVTIDPDTGYENNSTRITRPQFDHWYSKSKHIVLALSFYNLIPSCYVCNSSIKGDADFSLERHLHPFKNIDSERFSFNYRYEDIHANNVVINYKRGSKMENTLKEFKIKEVYNAHSEYELKDLLELRYKYSENYLDTLFNQTFSIGISKKEIYRMIFGVEYNEDEFHKRPFSRFKKDILEKLGVKI